LAGTPARALAAALIALIALTAAAPAAAETLEVARNVRLRQGPSSSTTSLKTLHKGERVDRLPGEEGHYVFVRDATGQTGWAYRPYLRAPAAGDVEPDGPGAPGESQAGVPARAADNLIVAAYNIQFLGQSPHEADKLARVIALFDVCGVLEIKSESALGDLDRALEHHTGADWGHAFGIRTHRPGGTYHEAYGALWRTDRVRLGDGVVSNVWDREEVYRNDPWVVSFRRGSFDFAMMLIHTRWSNDADGTRQAEVEGVPRQVDWMTGFLPDQDFLVAGDFNYPADAPQMSVLADQGLERLDPNERTTFNNEHTGYANAYDHIYATASARAAWTGRSGVVDATRLVYGDGSVDSMRRSERELSDHLPVWAEFRTD
jgi:endonuclease/exonuclease/phosphatase family metal-dependent hydrolase